MVVLQQQQNQQQQAVGVQDNEGQQRNGQPAGEGNEVQPENQKKQSYRKPTLLEHK
jgi:hypothetical protein